MRTRHYIAIALTAVGCTGLLFAKVGRAPLPQKCKASDLIAVVEITATNAGGASREFQCVATARVVESLKGRSEVTTFLLDYDTGLLCPNVLYARGERCLVFVTKLPTGHFTTYNDYYGKFAVTNDTVVGWEWEADKKLDAVRKEIRKHVD